MNVCTPWLNHISKACVNLMSSCVCVLDPTCDETGGEQRLDQEMKKRGNETTQAERQRDDEEKNNRQCSTLKIKKCW